MCLSIVPTPFLRESSSRSSRYCPQSIYFSYSDLSYRAMGPSYSSSIVTPVSTLTPNSWFYELCPGSTTLPQGSGISPSPVLVRGSSECLWMHNSSFILLVMIVAIHSQQKDVSLVEVHWPIQPNKEAASRKYVKFCSRLSHGITGDNSNEQLPFSISLSALD